MFPWLRKKRMRALLLSASVFARTNAHCQPGGLPEISRGLSASDTPGTWQKLEMHPGGVARRQL